MQYSPSNFESQSSSTFANWALFDYRYPFSSAVKANYSAPSSVVSSSLLPWAPIIDIRNPTDMRPVEEWRTQGTLVDVPMGSFAEMMYYLFKYGPVSSP